jgi:hypothetical protein
MLGLDTSVEREAEDREDITLPGAQEELALQVRGVRRWGYFMIARDHDASQRSRSCRGYKGLRS